MRQLSAPVRLAVTALVVAASAGCMSVSDDGKAPKPSVSAGHEGAVAESDGVAAVSAGAGKGRPGKHGAKASPGASAAPSPSGSAAPGAGPVSPGGRPRPQNPAPPGGGTAGGPSAPPQQPSQPPASPTPPAPPTSQPPPDPPVTPKPSDSPSASPAADTRTTALRDLGDGSASRTEPAASPQVGPV
ncbi:hypothetical protein [Streptomyces melanogenes]|uniref:Lipoprotein n=1 Tax=Streptomyces melanogenes TaxID=67326 RepID=A0ABZ1XNT2_9ACTN|nr:hypothetical protein [Streptomyces melanogenes]